jgi:hypothetical protein
LNEEEVEEVPSSKGERGHLARCVTHLAGYLFRRGFTAKARRSQRDAEEEYEEIKAEN